MSILSLVPPSGILCCCSWFPICAIAIANRHGASTGQCEREVHWLFIFGVVVLSAMVINLPLKWMNQGLRNNAGGDISFAQMSQAAKVCSAVLIALLAFSLAWGCYGLVVFFGVQEPCENVGVHRFGLFLVCSSALVCFACLITCLGVSCIMCDKRWFSTRGSPRRFESELATYASYSSTSTRTV